MSNYTLTHLEQLEAEFQVLLARFKAMEASLAQNPAHSATPATETTPIAPVTPQPVVVAPVQSMLYRFCLAIRDYEGEPGALNYRLNNPGDCRPSPVGYLPKYGNVEIIDTDTDPAYPYHVGKFAKFPTYELGWEYLTEIVKEYAAQNPTQNIIQFFQHYAPSSDNNNPTHYGIFVARRIGVDASWQIGGLL